MKKAAIIGVAVVMAWIGTAVAQNTIAPSGGSAGTQSAPGGHQWPDPEQTAQQLMTQFDANKDGELDQTELTQALEFLRQHHPQGHRSGGPQGSGQNYPQGGTNQVAGANGHQGPPPADKEAAHMIEKFSADKKGLTQAELVKALEARHAHGGPNGGNRPQAPGNNSGGQPSGTNPTP
jgi:hypothetical protein